MRWMGARRTPRRRGLRAPLAVQRRAPGAHPPPPRHESPQNPGRQPRCRPPAALLLLLPAPASPRPRHRRRPTPHWRGLRGPAVVLAPGSFRACTITHEPAATGRQVWYGRNTKEPRGAFLQQRGAPLETTVTACGRRAVMHHTKEECVTRAHTEEPDGCGNGLEPRRATADRPKVVFQRTVLPAKGQQGCQPQPQAPPSPPVCLPDVPTRPSTHPRTCH